MVDVLWIGQYDKVGKFTASQWKCFIVFFYHYEKYIASLEIVDYENYVLLEDDIAYKDKLLENKAMVSENVQLCSKGEADIEGILQRESWNPLGKAW